MYRTALCCTRCPSHVPRYRRLQATDGTAPHLDTIVNEALPTVAVYFPYIVPYEAVDRFEEPALVARSAVAPIPTPSVASLRFQPSPFFLGLVSLLPIGLLDGSSAHAVDL